jgi:alpha-tubulin suppressor-like RCC1 family protein
VQWEISTDGGETWNAIEGATSDQLTIASTQVSEDGNQYRAAFQNAAGTAISQPATLTVHAPPVVTEQPASTIVEVGESASFDAMASGFPAPTVQWEISTDGGKTWSVVAGATEASIAIEKTQVSENGDEYRAAFTSVAGKVTSAAATLTVATTKYGAAAWGENVFGELGDGSSGSSSDVPVPVAGLGFVTAVAAGGHHSLALLANGHVLAWGAGGFGQLGDDSLTASNMPVAVEGLSTAKAISAGANHSLALLDNGTVMAWGDNEGGQLGIGGASERVDTPVLVKGLSGVKAISAGANYSLALLSNGTVMAWGENESGQLGNGNISASSVPVAVKHLSNVSSISAGGQFSLALLSTGTVEAWGNDAQDQLANKTVEEGFTSTPVAVESLGDVAAIAAGADHGLALLSGGTVMAWGADGFGELGNGEVKPNEGTPVAVSGLSDVTAISAGTHDSAVLLGSGSVMTWGTNQSGVLGDGIPGGFSDVPVSVIGLAKGASISAGASHMLAYGEPIPTVTAVSPQLGPAAGGNTVMIAGTNFTGATAVSFGATEAASFTVNSPTSITATAPAGTGTVDVTVTTPSGRTPTGAFDRYTFQAPPTVVKLAAKSGPVGGGTIVTITGTEFTGSTNVSFGHTSATEFEVHSPSSITAVAPPSAAGMVDITVTNTAATSATTTRDHFKYLPVVDSLTPNVGATAGGTSVSVTGEGFALGSTATIFKFGTVRANSVNCTSSTTCTLITPAEPAGTIDVKATVNKANSAVNGTSDQFTYE